MNFNADPVPEENSVFIDLTSMIDVLFVLVLFFMVTTTFSDTSSIALDLPSASKQAVAPVKKDLSVAITQDGKIYLNSDQEHSGKPISLETLEQDLAALKKDGTELTLVVKADKQVEHGTVVSVMDKAKNAGIEKIAIAANVQAAN
jgi:biopolymer transport protein ExbD